ncbi:autotransporter outer membrane beta-barrel domain-containing protein [Ancylobacter sp. WKF20]|uniref:autotransporter family protein n=1 Tax=Ancylobacter sp. WKF20 TaxID=3039801 RepID=UPI0024345D22|nr:autotransporter outer membrane beta-barrel domain-containing protein [Ancylobacter sp. WKF20]WGD28424.1 autotransporter outer membrane beta-barrel domain-containing protein [Ancylobacter sp. WKF20]
MVRHVTAGVVALIASTSLSGGALGQSIWDPVISNSNWYVTVPQMLAYAAPPDNFANPLPIGDQTLWAIGPSVNGVFTGISTGTLAFGPVISTSTLTMQGTVTPSGEVSIVFTSTSGGSNTIGLGVMQEVGGVMTMEMQMIIGSDPMVSHWANMAPYDPATFTPPAPQAVPSNLSPQWAWSEGTPWRIVSPDAFGTSAPGTFIITGYKSGYFWGIGLRPDGTQFTLLGSITPQGRVLFNITDASSQLLSLYGGIEGDPSTAQMLLGTYDSSALFTGDITFTQVVRPYQETAEATGTVSAIGAAEVLYAVAGTPDGLIGAMAPVTSVLNNLSGSALSGALSQTVPVLSGAAAQATANTQRMIGQVVADRLADVDAAPDSQVWVQPLGGAGRQNAVDGVPGYTMSGGGFATGADRVFGSATRLGALFAFASTSLEASTDIDTASLAEGSADLQSYVFGLYGAHELSPGLNLTFAANAGVVDTSTSRSIAFMGSVAEASYQSLVLGLGAGLHKAYAVSDALTLTPGVRLDYMTVSSGSYDESGAGPLDLSVDSDAYQELILSAELALRYRLTDSLDLTARGSAGYNTLDTASAVTASFAGGGDPFVTTGPNVSRWLFTGGVGLASPVTENFSLGINYDMQASPSGYLNQIGSVRLKVRL